MDARIRSNKFARPPRQIRESTDTVLEREGSIYEEGCYGVKGVMFTLLRSTSIVVFGMGIVLSMSSLLSVATAAPFAETRFNSEISGQTPLSPLSTLTAEGEFEPQDNGKPDDAPGAGTRCV